jgi:adenosine kinase
MTLLLKEQNRRSYNIIGLGNALVDLMLPVEEKFLADVGLVKGTMSLMDEARLKNFQYMIPNAKKIPGGSAANTIVGLAYFGAKTAFIGKVADDELGGEFMMAMDKTGVDFCGDRVKQSALPTGCSFVFITPDSERTMNTHLGIANSLTTDDIKDEYIKAAQIIYIEGYLWDNGIGSEALNKAIDTAHANSVKVAFSLSDSTCVTRHREGFLHLLNGGKIDILFCNDVELKELYQEKNIDGAIDKLKNVPNVIAAVTMGSEGSIVLSPRTHKTVPIHKVDNVVDLTGAGDLYASGFLYGFSHGYPLEKCGAMGSVAAAEVISHFGARPKRNLLEHVRANVEGVA